jgi:hypothetical protein
VAHDLIFGKTPRDWSCGRAVAAPAPGQPWDRLPEVGAQAETVRAEVARAAATAIRLRRAGRMPDAEWKAFGKLHRRWLDLSDSRRGRWREGDSLLLWNLREACKDFTRRFATLGDLSRPASTALATVPPPPPATLPSSGAWHVALGAALALAGIGLFTRARER